MPKSINTNKRIPKVNKPNKATSKTAISRKALLTTALVGQLALSACSDDSNTGNNSDVAREDVTDSGLRDVGNQDSGFDAGFDGTDSNDITSQDAFDVNPDPSSDISSSDTVDVSLDGSGSDANSDVDTTPVPPVYINVQNVAGDFQVLDPETDSGEVEIANFELCADEGSVSLDSVRARIEGNFDVIPATLNIGTISRPISIRSGDGSLSLLSTDSVTINIEDGDCQNLVLTTNYQQVLENYNKWIRFELDQATSSTPGVVVRRTEDLITINPEFWETRVIGLHTVFQPENSMTVTSNLDVPIDEAIIIPSDELNFTVARFTARTRGEQLASIYGTKFRVETVPSTAQVPLQVEYYYRDAINNRYISIGGFSSVYANGSEIPTTFGPAYQDISFGNEISVRMSSYFVPEGLEGVQISLIDSDTDTETSTNYIISDPYEEVENLPLPWNNLEFVSAGGISVPEAVGYIRNFNNSKEAWYVWPTGFGDVYREGCYEYPCPLFNLSVEVNGVPDPRIPARLRGFNLDVNNSSDDTLTFSLKVTTGFPGSFNYVEHVISTVTASPNSTTTVDLRDLGVTLNELNGYRFNIALDLPDSGLPTVNPADILPEYINFTINQFDVSYDGDLIESSVSGQEFPGEGPYQDNLLPYQIADIYFGSPQVWLNTVSSRLQTIDLSDYESDTPITLFESSLDNIYGAIRVCEIALSHDIAKLVPPFENFYAVVNGNIAVNTYWDFTQAIFTFEGDCPEINAQSPFDIRVEGFNPVLDVRDGELRARFNLYALRASAVLGEGDTREIPTSVYVDVDSRGVPIQIESEPVNGGLTVFRQ
jgi:hypothetical protein